jgi:hypothetical protein
MPSTTNARKRRFDDAGGAVDDNDASNDGCAGGVGADFGQHTLSRLCHGVQRQLCRQLARWHAADSSAQTPAADGEDTRVAQWLGERRRER